MQIHKIEPELQNEELIKVNDVADKLRQHYQTLFDIAPVRYVMLKADSINWQAELFFLVRKEKTLGKRLAAFLDQKNIRTFQIFLVECLLRSGIPPCELYYRGGELQAIDAVINKLDSGWLE